MGEDDNHPRTLFSLQELIELEKARIRDEEAQRLTGAPSVACGGFLTERDPVRGQELLWDGDEDSDSVTDVLEAIGIQGGPEVHHAPTEPTGPNPPGEDSAEDPSQGQPTVQDPHLGGLLTSCLDDDNRPRLKVDRERARSLVVNQIRRLSVIREMPFRPRRGYALDSRIAAAFREWAKVTANVLEDVFENTDFSDRIRYHVIPEEVPPFGKAEETLASARVTVESADLPSVAPPDVPPRGPLLGAASNRVFIVHGRSDASREAVARFVEKLGLVAVVLHEQPNNGLTILEKFERHSEVGFAVVLLTGDDQGGLHGKNESRARARQNVIFEFGYFCALLGRRRVCALHEPGVELPSDLNGLVYVPLDHAGAWKLALVRELQAAEIPIDLSKAI